MSDTKIQSALRQALSRLNSITYSITQHTRNRISASRDVPIARKAVEKLNGAKEMHTIKELLSSLEEAVRRNSKEKRGAGQLHISSLMRDAEQHMGEFHDACTEFSKRCTLYEAKVNITGINVVPISKRGGSPSQMPANGSGTLHDLDDMPDDERTALLEQQKKVVLQKDMISQREQFEDDLAQEILQERNSEVKEMLENVRDINDIFSHIRDLTASQGEALDVMEGNVAATEESTRRAGLNLEQASRQASRNRMSQMVLIIIMIVFVVVVIAVLVS